MESVVIALLVLIVGLLAALLVRSRRGDEADAAPKPVEPPHPAIIGGSAAVPMPLTFDIDGQEIESYRIGDPQTPGRELLVEFVPSSLAQLTEAAGSTSPEMDHATRNALDGIVSSIPRAAAMIDAGMTMQVVGPPEALAGLARWFVPRTVVVWWVGR